MIPKLRLLSSSQLERQVGRLMRRVGRRALDRLRSSASRERVLRYADGAVFAPVTVVDSVSPHLIIVITPLA